MDKKSRKKELNRLDCYSGKYDYRNGVMGIATEYCANIFMRYMSGGSVLELGPAEGVMTDILYQQYPDYSVVDGSSNFAASIKARYPEMTVQCELFESFEPDRKYDNIILGHVLEHVDDPVEMLKNACSWLSDKGIILSAVPNSHSIHRQVGVKLGMIGDEHELNRAEKSIGHRRVYDMDSFLADFAQAGLHVKASGGYWLKPLANSQLEEIGSVPLIKAFMELGESYPEISGEIYIIAENLR